MRNLKKILALVLALMMVLSVMVTASAAFEDADSIQYTEAVDVMAAAGILTGYKAEDGTYTFNPTGTLTRAEAAKLIAYLNTAGKISGIVQCETVFEDVPAGHWASGLINYCYDEGIINGKTETTYAPNGQISVQEYAKLLLCVMGIEGTYTGPNWTKDIRNNAIANKLMVGMTYTWTANVTREQAAQMTFNAMTVGSTVTEASGYWYFMQDSKEVKVAESDIALYSALGKTILWKDVPGSATGFFKSFGITKTSENDPYGAPSIKYVVDQGVDADGEEIEDVVLYYAEAEDFIYPNTTTAATIAKDLKGYYMTIGVDTTIKVENTTKYAFSNEAGAIVAVDGAAQATLKVAASLSENCTLSEALAALTGANTVVRIYTDADKVITNIVVTNTNVDTIEAADIIAANPNATPATPEYVKVNSVAVVNTLGLKAGDVVTYTMCGAKVENVTKVEPMVGTLTGYNSKGEYTINDKVYTLDGVNASAVQAQFGKEYVYYVGANDTIILATGLPGTEAPEFVMPTDYAVVKGAEVIYVVSETAGDVLAGEAQVTKSVTFSARVKVLLADGTYAIYNLPVIKAAKDVMDGQTKLADKGDYYTIINGAIVELLDKAASGEAMTKGAHDVTTLVTNALTAQVYAYTVTDDVIALYAVSAIDKLNPTVTEDIVLVGCTNTTEVKKNDIVVTDFFGNKVLVNANTKVVYEYYDSELEETVTLVSTLGASNDLPVGYHGMIIAADYNKDTKGTASTADDVETVVYSAELIYVQAAPKAGAAAPVTGFAYVTGEYTFAGETVKNELGEDVKVYNYVAYAADGSVITLKSTTADLAAKLYKYDSDSYIGDQYSADYQGAYSVVAGNTVKVGDQYLNVTDNTVVVETGTNTLKANAYVLVFVESGFVGADANNIAVMFVVPTPAV